MNTYRFLCRRYAWPLLAPVLLCILGLLSGCKDDFLGPDLSGAGVIMPLKVGNQWIGRWTEYDDAGAVIATTYDTLTIESQVDRDGETWYRGSDDRLYINRADGLYRDATDDNLCGCRQLVAKYPGAPSDSFSTSRSLILLPDQTAPSDQVSANVLLAKDSAITTPAGTYSCHVYEPKLFAPSNARLINVERTYYAPNIGPVKKELKWTNPSRPMVWELVSVRLG